MDQKNASPRSEPPRPAVSDRPKIIAFGDSLTAGFGLESWQDSYPAKLQQAIDRDGFDYQVLNHGQGGDTAERGRARMQLTSGVGKTEFVVLAFGANDASQGRPPAAIRDDLAAMIEHLKSKRIDVLLCGIAAPAGNGPDYAGALSRMYSDLARDHNVELIPDLLAGVRQRNDLMLADGIHPNSAGAGVIQQNVYAKLRPMLAKAAAKTK